MKDKSLLLLAIMLITIGLSSSVYAGTCKTGHPFKHTAGGCTGAPGWCTGCAADTDAGGCGNPLGAANVCVHTPITHAHVSTYAWTWNYCTILGVPAICGYCTPTPAGQTAVGGSGANTGAKCTATPETANPVVAQ